MIAKQPLELAERDAGVRASSRRASGASMFASISRRTRSSFSSVTPSRKRRSMRCGPMPSRMWVCRNQSPTEAASARPWSRAIRATIMSSAAMPPEQVMRSRSISKSDGTTSTSGNDFAKGRRRAPSAASRGGRRGGRPGRGGRARRRSPPITHAAPRETPQPGEGRGAAVERRRIAAGADEHEIEAEVVAEPGRPRSRRRSTRRRPAVRRDVPPAIERASGELVRGPQRLDRRRIGH